QIERAQRLAVKADDGAELDVEIDVLVALLLAAADAGQRGLDEAASIVDVAAHGHAQRAVRSAIGLQRGLVAVGRAEYREIRRHHFARRVELDRALERGAGRLDDDILETGRPGLVDQREAGAAGATGGLRPAGQQVFDPGLGQIGLDGDAAVALLRRHAPGELDRHRPGKDSAEVKAKLVA